MGATACTTPFVYGGGSRHALQIQDGAVLSGKHQTTAFVFAIQRNLHRPGVLHVRVPVDAVAFVSRRDAV